MNLPNPSPIICPVCGGPLSLQDSMLRCSNGHPFNVAKEGYVNLLLSHQRKSKTPGDDPEMVRARRRFFDSGAYGGLTQAVRNLPLPENGAVLDCGCGEGHLLGTLSGTHSGFCCGIDISKKAVQLAAKRHRQAAWLVANGMRDIPIADSSMDLILSVLAPRNNDEFYRILKPGGKLVLGVPGPNHLIELRRQLQFSSGDFADKADAAAEKCAPLFKETNRQPLCTAETFSAEQLADLIRMTPIFWRSGDEAKAKLTELDELTVTTSFTLLTLEKA